MNAAHLLVVGTGTTGRAVIADALARGHAVSIWDDRPVVASEWLTAQVIAPGTAPERALEGVTLVIPSPGVPVAHPVLIAAERQGIPVRSEIDIAAERASAPIVAVTGTNGKTTVTTLIQDVLAASGRKTVAAGNIGRPLIEVVDDSFDVIVAECSSFQLQYCNAPGFRVAVYLNIDVDHLDWHPTFAHYAAAKARIMNGQTATDLLVYNADDPVVARAAADASGRAVSFSLRGAPGSYTQRDRTVVAPDGSEIMEIPDRVNWAPHDVANLLAVVAATHDLGVSFDVIAGVARNFAKLPHRLEWICEAGGVQFVDDSKATNPHAAIAAIRAFDRVVLIAGGRNKGLDLSGMRDACSHLVGVVAIGDAAPEVEAVFTGIVPTVAAASMRDAVYVAAGMASAGDTVLLSPACASFDWYRDYAERGTDFANIAGAWAEEAGQ
ncbi:MAG: UDP-N-acetylmuramoyl-L-alanine--D-glutamate ligase [Acidimicrobiia bacterium]